MINVLVIDDNQHKTDWIVKTLIELTGPGRANFYTRTNLRDGLNMLATELDFDLIMLDMQFPINRHGEINIIASVKALTIIKREYPDMLGKVIVVSADEGIQATLAAHAHPGISAVVYGGCYDAKKEIMDNLVSRKIPLYVAEPEVQTYVVPKPPKKLLTDNDKVKIRLASLKREIKYVKKQLTNNISILTNQAKLEVLMELYNELREPNKYKIEEGK